MFPKEKEKQLVKLRGKWQTEALQFMPFTWPGYKHILDKLQPFCKHVKLSSKEKFEYPQAPGNKRRN